MLYEDPKTLLQQKLNEVLKPAQETLISNLIELALLQKATRNKDNLVFSEIYNLLGLDTFTELIQLLGGKTITFPAQEDFKETIQLCLSYYYHIVEGKSWDDVRALVMEPDLQTVKFGIKSKQFDTFLKAMLEKQLGVPAADYDKYVKTQESQIVPQIKPQAELPESRDEEEEMETEDIEEAQYY